MSNFWSSSSLSNLFASGSTSGNSNAGLYSLFTDRASIKNGSYGKLMKSYYSTTKGASETSGSSSASKSSKDALDKILDSKKNPTVSKAASKANAEIGQKISNMQSSISALQKTGTYEDTQGGSTAKDKVAAAVKNFVDDYNSLVNTSKDSTLTSKTSNVAAMMRSTSANADKLAEIGISVNSDGTVSLDEKALKSADISKVQELFSADNIVGYGSTLASRVRFAGGGSSSVTSTDSVSTKQATDASAAGVKADSKALADDATYAKVKDADGNETDKYDVDSILSKVKSYATNYNAMLDAAKDSTNSGVTANLSRIKDTTTYNKDALAGVGISVGDDGKLSVNESAFKNADMENVQKLFKDYGSSVATSSSLVNYYMNTQADASNGYTSSAAYNVQGDSSYTTIT